MKILPVGDLVLKIEMGIDITVRIYSDFTGYEEESKTEKTYLSSQLKQVFFPEWGLGYFAVKGNKRWQFLFDFIAEMVDPDLDYSDFLIRSHEEIKLERFVADLIEVETRVKVI